MAWLGDDFTVNKKWKVQEKNLIPNLRTAVLEKLQELGDHDVQRTIQHVTVQDLGRVLTDLLQGSKRSLRDKIEKDFLTVLFYQEVRQVAEILWLIITVLLQTHERNFSLCTTSTQLQGRLDCSNK